LADLVKPGEGCAVEQSHRGETGLHGDGIRGEGAAVWQGWLAERRIEHRHELLAASNGTDWKAAANDLPKRSQIRIDAPQTLRSVIAKTESDDLVEDQQRPHFARHLAECLQISLIRRHQ